MPNIKMCGPLLMQPVNFWINYYYDNINRSILSTCTNDTLYILWTRLSVQCGGHNRNYWSLMLLSSLIFFSTSWKKLCCFTTNITNMSLQRKYNIGCTFFSWTLFDESRFVDSWALVYSILILKLTIISLVVENNIYLIKISYRGMII